MPERLDPKSTARKLGAKQKQAKAVNLRTQGYTWQQISDELGYTNPGTAHNAVSAYLKNYPAPEVDELRAQENLKLDTLELAARKVLSTYHVTVQNGKVVGKFAGYATDPDTGEVLRGADDKPIATFDDIEDDAPVLAAISSLLRIAERRAKLNGLDKPILVKFEDESAVDNEIEELVATMNNNVIAAPQGHEG